MSLSFSRWSSLLSRLLELSTHAVKPTEPASVREANRSKWGRWAWHLFYAWPSLLAHDNVCGWRLQLLHSSENSNNIQRHFYTLAAIFHKLCVTWRGSVSNKFQYKPWAWQIIMFRRAHAFAFSWNGCRTGIWRNETRLLWSVSKTSAETDANDSLLADAELSPSSHEVPKSQCFRCSWQFLDFKSS